MWASISVFRDEERIHYRSERVWPKAPASCDVTVDVAAPLPESEIGGLEVFLINRYRLYSRMGRRVVSGEVDHAPYPLSRVRLVEMPADAVQSAWTTGRHSLFAWRGRENRATAHA
jgi:uncharacterized protein YqjF (DUF2071 family)